MSGEQASLKLWLEVVSVDGEPVVRLTPVSDENWKTIQRDILNTRGVRLQNKDRSLEWSGPAAVIIYNTLTGSQKERLDTACELEMGANAKIQIQRTYRDVLLDYEVKYA